MSARGWGVLVALGAIAGAGIGIAVGEPSAGLLLGLAAGVAAALLATRSERNARADGKRRGGVRR